MSAVQNEGSMIFLFKGWTREYTEESVMADKEEQINRCAIKRDLFAYTSHGKKWLFRKKLFVRSVRDDSIPFHLI